MFFSKKKRKERQRLEDDLKAFKNIVKMLMDAIYKLDEYIQTMNNKGDYTYDTIAYIHRSIEDVANAILIYNENRFTHNYYSPKLLSVGKELLDTSNQLHDHGKNLSIIVKNFQLTKDGIDAMIDSELDIDGDAVMQIRGKMLNMNLTAKQITLTIYDDLMTIRDLLYQLRNIVGFDHIAIMSGTDLVLLYEYFEAKFKQELKCEIRFDRCEIRRIKHSIKEEST